MSDWTPERHAEAKARCEAATDGPWYVHEQGVHKRSASHWNVYSSVVKILGGFGKLISTGPYLTPESSTIEKRKRYEADATFMAEGRTDLPDALREIERLGEEVDTQAQAKTDMTGKWSYQLERAETAKERLGDSG